MRMQTRKKARKRTALFVSFERSRLRLRDSQRRCRYWNCPDAPPNACKDEGVQKKRSLQIVGSTDDYGGVPFFLLLEPAAEIGLQYFIETGAASSAPPLQEQAKKADVE